MAFTVIRMTDGLEEKIYHVGADVFEILEGGVLKTVDHEKATTTYHSPSGWARVETRDSHPHGVPRTKG